MLDDLKSHLTQARFRAARLLDSLREPIPELESVLEELRQHVDVYFEAKRGHLEMMLRAQPELEAEMRMPDGDVRLTCAFSDFSGSLTEAAALTRADIDELGRHLRSGAAKQCIIDSINGLSSDDRFGTCWI